jgi:hypothetical protein
MRNFRRLAVLAALILGLVGVGATPARAGTTQISGTASFDDPEELCPDVLPSGFDSYPALVMDGDLEGCWYTHIESSKDNGAPSGVYLETGSELFIPFEDPDSSFTTTYKFESKWDPDVSTGVELKGRCQHPIVAGTGEFAGVKGRVDFKDVITATGTTFVYRGHLKV